MGRRQAPTADNPTAVFYAHDVGMTTDPYRCEICDRIYPVPILARDCENKHLREDT